MLKNKTRILITHAVEFLDKVDRVIVMEQGNIIHQGHFNDLKHLDYFKVVLNNTSHIEDGKDSEETKQTDIHHDKSSNDFDTESSNDELTYRAIKINNDESKEKITVNWQSFYKFFFFSYLTIFTLFFVVVILIFKVLIHLQFTIYLLQWVRVVSKRFKQDKEKFNRILIWKGYDYTIFVASFAIQLLFTLTISVRLFRRMLKRLLYAPLNLFFDVTPSGMILNRFSKDFRTVEILLIANVLQQVEVFISIVITIILAAYNFIWILIIVPVIAISLIFCYVIYVKGLKEATRVEAITSSPILTNLSESINGASTIRVYDKIDEFEHKQYFLQDRNGAFLLLMRAIQGWFNCMTTFIIIIFLLIAFST